MKRIFLITVSALMLALSASVPSYAGDTTEVQAFKKAIRAQYDLKEKAFAAHDANTIVDKFYAEDVISAGEGEAVMSGREKIRPLYEDVVKGHTVKIESFSSKVSGNLGWDWTNFYVTPTDPKEQPFSFVIVFLWEKVNGKWICAGDMFVKGSYKAGGGAAAASELKHAVAK